MDTTCKEHSLCRVMRGMVAFALLTSAALGSAFVFFRSFPGLAVSPPNLIPYQGRVLDANGVPVAAASADMQFRLYDSLAAGTCLWSNASATCASNADLAVTLTDGLFSENLGDTGAGYAAIADSVFADDASVYLEVQVEGETLSPRKRLGAAAYAMNANTVDGLDSGDFFQQGGNSYGITATIGTNDTEDFAIETDGTARLTFDTTGAITLPLSGSFVLDDDATDGLDDDMTLEVAASSAYAGFDVTVLHPSYGLLEIVDPTNSAPGIALHGDTPGYNMNVDNPGGLGTAFFPMSFFREGASSTPFFQMATFPDDDGWNIYGPSVADPGVIQILEAGTVNLGAYAARADGSSVPLLCASTRVEETASNLVQEACFMADGSLDLGLALAGTNTTVAQGGIDRTSGAAETFAFTNGGAGTLGITVDGTADVTGHSAIGADAVINDGSLLYPDTYSNVLNVSETSTDATVDFVEGITSYLLYDPSADASTVGVYGTDSEVFSEATNSNDIESLNGGYFLAEHDGTGTITDWVNGITALVNTSIAGGSSPSNSAGWFSTYVIDPRSSGTEDNYGLYSSLTRTGATGGTINTYGLYLDIIGLDNAGAGTHSAYGLYLENITGADTNYALYSAGGQSYHAGNFGIGATTPDADLDIEAAEDTERVRLTDSSNADSVGLYVGDGTAGLDGTLSAQAGSIFLDEDGKLWVNMDGSTNWDQVATTAGGSTDLDGVYDNDSDKKMAVDNASGLEFESTVAGDVIVDLQSSGDFEIQSVGTTFATFNDSGNVAFENTVTLGSSSADAVLFNADVDTSILPDDDDTYDLGADAARWRDLYLGPATLHIGSLVGDEGTLSYDTTANALVVNESGTDTDFRLEGDTDTDLLFVDASADQVGIGGTPLGKLSVDGDADETQLLVQAHSTQTSNLVVIENSSANDLVVVDGTGNMGIGDSTPNALLDLDTGSPAGRTIGTLASGTQSGDLTALELDFDSLMAGAADADFTGVNLLTPNLTQSTAVTTSYLGYNLTAGNITQDTLAGTVNWTGARIAMPVQQELAGTITTSGLTITDNGSSNSGIKRGLFVDFGGIQSGGTVVGLDIDSITTGGGNGLGVRVGSGFDTDLVFVDSTAVVRTPNAGTLDFQDASANSLMLLTDAGSTGNLDVSGTFGADGNVTFGDAGADTVTSNAASWTFAADTAVTLSGGTNGLNFDSDTLSIDATSDRVGIETAAPSTQLHVYNGTGGVNYATAFHVGSGTYGAFIGDSMDTEVSPSFLGRPNGTAASTYLYSRIDTAEDSGTTPVMVIEGQTATGPGAVTTRPLLSINNYTTQLLTVDVNGALGIGDTTPDARLDVVDATSGIALRATSDTLDAPSSGSVGNQALVIETNEAGGNDDLAIFRSDADGTPDTEFIFESDGDAFADGTFTGGGADYAEYYHVSDQGIEAGDAVCLDAEHPGDVARCASTDEVPVGVVSTKPGFLANGQGRDVAADPSFKPVGLLGQVPTKVSLENGDIAVGDPLAASPTVPGYAAKALAAGQVIGYALEPMSAASSDALILVFVRPGHVAALATAPMAGADNAASELSPSGFSSLTMNGNIYMQGNQILDVGAIAGLGGIWSVDAEGTFRTEGSYRAVITSYQDEKVEAVAPLSLEHKVTLDGTATLENGTATVSFEAVSPSFNDITSTTADIRVSVTPNGPAYLYVVSKDHNGFTVQQLNGTDSGITFDWFVSAYRKDYEPVVEAPPVEEPPAEVPPTEEPPVLEEPPAVDLAPTEPPPAEPAVEETAPAIETPT